MAFQQQINQLRIDFKRSGTDHDKFMKFIAKNCNLWQILNFNQKDLEVFFKIF